MTPSITLLDIDPDLARAMLVFNTGNRNLNERHVKTLADDMANGRWIQNGETIKFDESGKLLDGQKRLHAVIKADVRMTFLVVRGLKTSAQATIDIGQIRTVGNQLKIMGLNSCNETAAVGLALWRYQNHPDKVWGTSNTRPSKPEQVDFVQENLDLLEPAVVLAHEAYQTNRIRTSSYGPVAVLALGTGYEKEFADFHNGFVSGAGLSQGDSRLALRSRVLNFAGVHNYWEQQQLFALTIKAFNSYLRQAEVKKLVFSKANLPMPIIGQ
jgi:hypothetical protein